MYAVVLNLVLNIAILYLISLTFQLDLDRGKIIRRHCSHNFYKTLDFSHTTEQTVVLKLSIFV